MQADMAWADKADQLIALDGAAAVGALLESIAAAVRLGDDVEVSRLDRLLQQVEKRLQQSSQMAMPSLAPARAKLGSPGKSPLLARYR